jgi:hypothetical protein
MYADPLESSLRSRKWTCREIDAQSRNATCEWIAVYEQRLEDEWDTEQRR